MLPYPSNLAMSKILTEKTPLSDCDCFYLVDRHKDKFDYPLHVHDDYELNFVENCAGVKRIVGDNIEVVDRYDLVLVGPGLAHTWEQGECEGGNIREVTIQFSADLFCKSIMDKNQMKSLAVMFEKSTRGLRFGMKSILNVYSKLQELLATESGFYQVMRLLEIFYELSVCNDYCQLSTGAFARTESPADSRRIKAAEDYVNAHFQRNVTLQELADVVKMTPTAFSRFFHQRTGRTLSDYIIDVRLGKAARMLADTTMIIAEICYDCGFNNISNFNRIFKKKRGCSPSEFRSNYRKTKIII